MTDQLEHADVKRETFVFHRDWYEALKSFPADVRLEVIDAIMSCVFEKEKKELSSVAKACMSFIEPVINRDLDKYMSVCQRNRKNGKYGGRPRKQETQLVLEKTQKTQDNPKNLDHDNDHDNDNIDKESINIDSSSESSDALAKNEKIDFCKLGVFFNKSMNNKSIPKIRGMTKKRKTFIMARMREYGKRSIFSVITKAAESCFLNGRNNRGFVANFDWMFLPNNFPKILEGNYDNEYYQKNENKWKINDRGCERIERANEALSIIARLRAEDSNTVSREE